MPLPFSPPRRCGPVNVPHKDIIHSGHGPVRMVQKDIINNRHGPAGMAQIDIIWSRHGPVRIAWTDIINTRHGPTSVTQINIIQSRDWPVHIARTYCYLLSLDSLLLMLPGQLVPIRYNLYFGQPASTAYNTIPAGARWPVWLSKLSSWVSGMIQEIPLNGLSEFDQMRDKGRLLHSLHDILKANKVTQCLCLVKHWHSLNC